MDWKGKKVLVNGITGFIGSNIGKELLARGADVHSIDNFSYINFDVARVKLEPTLDKVKVIWGDVSRKETWDKVPRDIEYIFHFAAPSSVTLFKREPERCYRETVYGFWHALDFAKANGVKKVVYPSSGSNYAGNEMPHKEDISLKPRNIYAAAKVACEGLANSYSDFVKVTGLRIFGGYGPGEEWKKDFGSVLYMFIRDYLEGRAPEIWGDGTQTRDFIHVDDIVQGVIRSAEVEFQGVINLGTGNPVSYRDLLNEIKSNLGVGINPVYLPKEKNYVENLKADTALMKNVLGITPMNYREGVAKFITYLKTEKKK